MKKTITIVSSVVSGVIFMAIFTFSTFGQVNAETTMPDGQICPANFICRIRPVTPTAITCPTGYVCTLQSATSTRATSRAGERPYRPGSYYSLLTQNANTTGSTTQQMTAAQIQAAAQAQAQAQASASTTGTGSQLTAAQMQAAAQAVASSTATSTYAQQMAAQANAIVARAPTSWPQDGGFKADPGSSARSAWFGFYAPAAGHPVQSDCGPNQFMSMLANPVSCIDNFATNSPIVLNPAVPFDPSGNVVSNTITDPYCAGLTAREGIGSSRQHLIDSTKTRTSQGSEGVVDSVWQQKINCFVGEAYKNQPYANPWVTANNLFGINQIYLHPSKGTTVIWTNFCKDAITLSEAKKRNDQQLAAGVHNDLYTNNSRLYVPPVYAPSLESVENSLTYLDHPGTNMNYWWNGNKASQAWSTSYETFYTQGDIKDPEFLALFNAFQFEQTTASNVPILMRCMDPGYISNLPPVAGHYQSEIIHDKKLGLIQ